MTAILGVDLGGTRLRAVLSINGRTRRFEVVCPPREELPNSLRAIVRRRKLDGLVIGARGVWTHKEREALRKSVASLAHIVRILPDIELAWRAAFGTGAGVVVVAGTGSIAYARTANGRSARAGGLGPLLGDEGSSFWIGKQWLKTRPEAEQRRATVRSIAALSPKALRERPRLATEAAAHLTAIARQAAARAGLRGNVRISWQGGLFTHDGLRRRFLQGLPRTFKPMTPLQTPEEAACKLLP
ncbi:MAG: hypothetical protein COB53_13245 [Elusimicrobia bacterium]|nr:MAG: hypothetical protein COB53_13245 [Elusimicrobiota bacterium]